MIDWDLLGIDETDASVRDVKRAYAKQLRQFRPEKDPAGFERLHQTYTRALDHVKCRESEGLSKIAPINELAPILTEEVEEAPPAARSDIHIFPDKVKENAAQISAAVRSGDAQKTEIAIQNLDVTLAGFPNSLRIWERVLELIQGETQEIFFEAISFPILMREISTDHCSLSLRTINFWVQINRFVALKDFAGAIKDAKEILKNESTGQVAASLADALSVIAPNLAEDMLNIAFEWLPKSDREWRLPGLENRITLGAVFTFFPEDQREFWAASLTTPENSDWESEECRNAVLQLVKNFDPDWRGYDFLCQVLPEEIGHLIE